MTGGVVAHAIEDVGVRFDAPEKGVAGRAERASNRPSGVAVVHEKVALDTADQTTAVLRFLHGVDVLRGEAVLALVTGAEILGLRSLGIGAPPRTKSRVALLPVGRAVLAVAETCALSALSSAEPPIRERIVRQFARALAALGHTSTVPRNTDMQVLDQPCHADVLLEIANQEAQRGA